MSYESFTEHRGFRHPFILGTNFLGGVGDTPKTIAELAMCQCSAILRSKPRWWDKLQSDGWRRKYEQDALQRRWRIRTAAGYAETSLTSKQVDYVFSELTGYAALVDEENRWQVRATCQVSCFDRIWESENVLNVDAAMSLDSDIIKLRLERTQTPTHDEDGVTTTLIDPLLNSIIYGWTRVQDIRTPEQTQVLPAPSQLNNYFMSQKFTCIPTDFDVSATGSVKSLGYINNLHPDRHSTQASLERLVQACIPLFSHVLTDLHRNNPLPQRIIGSCRYTEWDEPEPPEDSDDDDGWSVYESQVRHWVMNRPLAQPDVPPAGYSGGLQTRKSVVDLKGRTVQIIAHAYEVSLKPGGLEFLGSPWHVEGMKNEQIAACALHYSSVENITSSSIEFRMAVASPRGFEAGDSGATARTWALKDGDPCHQYIGTKEARSGFTIAFPNIYQYRHAPFKLSDPQRPGHQRVMALYLVDPDIRPIISTSRVPPQQKDWMITAVAQSIDSRLPTELVDKITYLVEGVIDVDEAENHRKEMAAERAHFWGQSETYHFSIPFDVWNGLY